jgi:hypothetical protein
MSGNEFRLPTNRQRVSIFGRTGSGKTQCGAWLLSTAPFDKQPYIMVDYKGDDLLNSIERVEEIGLNEVPKHPGLYRIQPRPETDDEAMNAWLMKVWQREKTGLYIDEGYMLPKGGAFDAILTQGRSKNIPCICLTQRPCWISRFVFSEADYYAAFSLNHRGDRQKVREFFPADYDPEASLEEFWFTWYDVGKNNLFRMMPVPHADEIVGRIDERLKPKRHFL